MQHERREAGRERDPRRRAPGAAEQHRERATSSATYSASPMIPCSAATVTGIVCEAEVAFSALALRVTLVLGFERPRAVALERAFGEQFEAARDQRWCARWWRCWPSRPSPSGRSAGSAGAPAARRARERQRARRDTYSVARTLQRQAASTASPSSSAAMLDCEKLVTSPASSHASTAAPTSTSRRARGASTSTDASSRRSSRAPGSARRCSGRRTPS